MSREQGGGGGMHEEHLARSVGWTGESR
jgi:hypothetical protein